MDSTGEDRTTRLEHQLAQLVGENDRLQNEVRRLAYLDELRSVTSLQPSQYPAGHPLHAPVMVDQQKPMSTGSCWT
jgi:hypothetical protein